MKKALEDILVLDLSQIYQGPYCTLLLAYQGAKVIKIENPNGDLLRHRVADKNPHEFLMFNSNKRGMTLNLKTDEGRNIFLEMAKKADVVVENFTPGVMKRLGIDYETLKEINPRIIYASATGFGLEGPYKDFPGMDLTLQAISGIMATTGFPESPPVKAGPAICDLLGGIHLYGGITTALFHRERTGVGQLVEVSMHDTVYPSLASALSAYYEGGGSLPQRTGNRHSGLRMAPYNVYETSDGHVAIICVSEKHWENLATLMGKENLIGQRGYKNTIERSSNMEVVDDMITAWTQEHKKWDLVDKLRKARVPCSPVLTIDEVANDPHLKSREMIKEVNHPVAGITMVPGNPIRLSKSTLGEVKPSPYLGEHTEVILKEMLNTDQEQVFQLRAEGII